MTDAAEEGTLEPTPERLRRARRDGDFGASGAPGGALAFLAFVLASPTVAGVLLARSGESVRAAVGHAGDAEVALAFSPRGLALDLLALAGPVLGLAGAVALAATLAETRFGFAPRRLWRGAGGGGGSVGGAARGVVYAALGLSVTLATLAHLAPAVVRVAGRSPTATLRASADLGRRALQVGAALALGVAAVEVAAATLARRARLRMTPRAVDDERRAADGDPQTRAARRRAAELGRLEVALSSLVTEHVACVEGDGIALVLAWRPEADAAPRLARVGRGDGARALTRDAAAAAIPIHNDSALAASLAAGREVGDAIDERDYEAVAELLTPPAAS